MTIITTIQAPRRISTREAGWLDFALDTLLEGRDVAVDGRVISAKSFDGNAILMRELRRMLAAAPRGFGR
jgi:hypothetical protein